MFGRVSRLAIVTWLRMITPRQLAHERCQIKWECIGKKNDPLNVAGNYCDYSGGYDGGALQRTVLNWGLAGIEAVRY